MQNNKIVSEKCVNKETNCIYQKAYECDFYPHSICTPSLASNIITNKFVLGIPYYHQEQYLFNKEVEISRQNLCNYQIRTSDLLKRFYIYLKELLFKNKVEVIHADETTLNILKVNNKNQCYVWLYTSSFNDYPIISAFKKCK